MVPWSTTRTTILLVTVTAMVSVACQSSPSQPSSNPARPTDRPTMSVSCAASPTLRCSATLYGEGDVTARASWSAADSFRLAMDLSVTASSVVVFRSPGVPTAVQSGNVYIRADYTSSRWGQMRNIAPHAYAVRPNGDAVPLAYLTGYVFNGPIGLDGRFVGGATVEIVDGEDAGKRQTTLDNGSYMIEFLHLNAPFTARASKTGYTTDVRQHPGIVDSAGFPSNNSLHFSLSPSP